MGFETEHQMKGLAERVIPDALNKSDFDVLTEFDYGSGRSDLVFVNVSQPYWDHRINKLDLKTPIDDKHALISFLHLHSRREPVTEEYFYEMGALPRRYKRSALDWLKTHGFVDELETGKIHTARYLRRHVTTTVAVELKLRKWKDAIKQASRGRSFADYKYVALDHDHIEPAIESIERFKEHHIGLISIDTDGDCYCHYSPPRGSPHSNLIKWKLNELTMQKESA